MRLGIISCVWGRISLTRVWWHGIARLRSLFQAEGIGCDVFVAGSESAHYVLCAEHQGRWVEAVNQPLGAKWNDVCEAAFGTGMDYALVLGSDDFLSDGLGMKYVTAIRSGTMYAGCQAFYFYDVRTERCCLAGGNTSQWQNQPIGAGRLMARRMLEPANFRPWPDEKHKALDAGFTAKMHPLWGEMPEATLFAVNEARVGLDVKSGWNIWPYDRLSVRNPVVEVERDRILGGIPEGKMIRALRAYDSEDGIPERPLQLVRDSDTVGDAEETQTRFGCFGRRARLAGGQPDGDLPPAA